MMGVVFLVEGVIFLIAKGIHSDVLMKKCKYIAKTYLPFYRTILSYSSISNSTAKINRNSKFSVLIFNSQCVHLSQK